MRVYAEELKTRGHKIVSRWVYDDSVCDVAEGVCAQRDLDDLEGTDTLIAFTGGGRGGRHVELGYSLAIGTNVIVIGKREHIFHYLPYVKHYNTWQEYLDELGV
jgi:hypothetical protein